MSQIEDQMLMRIERFYDTYCKEAIVELSNAYPDKRSLYINFFDLNNFDANIAERLLEEPDEILPLLITTLIEFDIGTGVQLEKAHPCITNLPILRKVKIRNIRNEDIDTLISIDGLVLKATEVRPKLLEAIFECPSCHHIFSVAQTGFTFTEPLECEQESGGCGRRSASFKLIAKKKTMVNSQKIRLQETHEDLRGGELPQTIDVYVEDDLTGKVSPGNRVTVTGILRAYQRITRSGKTPFFDLYFECNSLEVKETEFEEIEISNDELQEIRDLGNQPDIYEKLIRSIAPTIYGYEEIKEALVLQLFGGTAKLLPDKTRLRGDIHVLLVGDPGAAKSMLLTYIAQLAPRGLYTGGKSSSAAGLTAAAVKDEFGEGRWTLEAGALVLADKGIACVDELDKMKKEDRDALHEALEQQTISIAKAGITARLNSRCALLGAANPKYGRFDKYTPISEQINMPSTLLSRFDLIFTIMDRPNEEVDMKTAEHIMSVHYAGELLSQSERIRKEDLEAALQIIEPAIPEKLLRKYIAYSKDKIKPLLTKEAKNKFLDFYIGLRRQGYEDEDEDAPVPITARQLEALIRLGEAKARTRLSNEITTEDAERVINVVTYCLKRVFVDPETGKLDADWITVGTTKTRRDRARSIREIMKELEKEYGEEVPIEEVLDLAEEEGMEREKAEDIIEVMKRDGILFSPGSGVIKFVR